MKRKKLINRLNENPDILAGSVIAEPIAKLRVAMRNLCNWLENIKA